jgi:multidrug efflux pump
VAFTDLFIRRPVLSIVVSLLILLIGLRALVGLPVRQYPELKNTVITVTTTYPGATAELMQGFVTTQIQQAVATAEGIEYLTSSSSTGRSVITAHILLNFDPNRAMTEVMSKVNQVRAQLPREINDPVILKSTGESTAAAYIGFYSEQISSQAITDYLVRVVQPKLSTIPGVASADVLGAQTFALRIWLNPARLAARGLSPSDVAAALRANNYQSAPGQTKSYFTISNLTADTGLKSVAEFENMVVATRGGVIIRLKEVATIELGAENSDSSVVMNGLKAVFIGINTTPTANPINVVAGVRDMIPELSRNLPPGVEMRLVYDSTQFIRASINEVIRTLGEAVLIVVVVIFLFLGSIRSVLIPIVTIPLSLVGVCMFLLALGFSLNLLTLLAMVLAIGLVVDDAIVVVENIDRHIQEGATPMQAALVGAREIVGPVISMTITLAAVYAPIGFMGGLTGSLFREFAFTLAGSVIISGVVALTLSPMMCSRLLKGGDNGRFAARVERTFHGLSTRYRKRLSGTLDYRPVTALFAAVVLASIYFLYTGTKAELAPPEDQGIIFVATTAPQYANIDYMEAYGARVDQVFQQFPETANRFIINGNNGPNNGFAGMNLKSWEERDRSAQTLLPLVQRALSQIEGVNAFAFSRPPLPGGAQGLPVQMVINSTSGYEVVFRAMEEIKAEARKSGMFIVVDSDLRFNNPQSRIHIDRFKANEMGITMQSIGDALAVLLGGNYINRFDLYGRSYQVIPQVPRRFRLDASDLDRYFVTTSTGAQVPLSTIVSVEHVAAPNALTQYGQLNSATFQAVPMPGVTVGQAVTFLREQTARILPADFGVDWLSDARQYVQEGNQLAITFAFAVIIIFLVLAAQFESLRDPLVILISVPMSICGALIPLYLGLATINIYTQIGLVTLVGLISKHGILMTEFANQLQETEKVSKREAIERAAQVRLRPILMTTAAMVVGLVPLLTATGAGAASRFDIGLVIVAGMSIGTLFTLFVVPAVYMMIAKDHASGRTDAVPAPAPAE